MYNNIVAVSTFLQPRWIVPSKKPKDLEIGWKEICDNNALGMMSQTRRSQKRISDFSGLISTEMVAEFKHNLINQSSFGNHDYVRMLKIKSM